MEASQPKPGDVLGRYQLLLPIAKGGMGQVWAARLTGTRGFQKLVAVKTILCASDDSGGDLEAMLFEEASLASQIRHPNVAQTLDLGEQEGALYLVMEWVDGEPLDFVMRAARSVGGVPLAIAVHLIIQGCKGLHAAHEAKNAKGEPLGIVHRDVSPQNLLVSYSGVVKLVDFGVAKATQQMSEPTALGTLKGKFAYMSPEQVQGEAIDGRSDVFGMGIVLYRLTTGVHPFKADNPAATIRNILTKSPPRPSEFVPDYPAPLEAVVMKALARDKHERFASAHEMMLALERALPAPVNAHAERNTEIFLHRLFQNRITERNEALQAAMKAAARASGTMAMPPLSARYPRSHSTMRGVSLDAADDSPASTSNGPEIVLTAEPTPPGWRWPAFAVAASIAIGVGFMMLSGRGFKHGSAAGPGGAHASPVAVTTALKERRQPTGDSTPTPSASREVASSAPAVSAPAPSISSGTVPPKKRERPSRHDGTAGVSEPAPSTASGSRIVRPTTADEIDPLNRRK